MAPSSSLDSDSPDWQHPETSAFALKLKTHMAVRDLMLAYVTMILNHHRLCHLQNHPHLPLNLIELCQATQQIGAFQVRVRQALAQVLFSALQRSSFWQHWAHWGCQILTQWHDQPPAICRTPGLLPLHHTEGVWSWREGVVIQAMALEAAHELVESLPPEALEMEALEQLLGLQDALVEDSSTLDPRGFEGIPLGVPLLSSAGGDISIQLTALDPTVGRLPKLIVKVCPQSPVALSATQILGQWVWALTRQFGVEVSYVGLSFLAQLAKAQSPGCDLIQLDGHQLLSDRGAQHPKPGIKSLIRRVELLCQSDLRWEEQQLSRQRLQSWQGKLWVLEAVESSQALSVGIGDDQFCYQAGNIDSVVFRLTPGRWCRRLIQLYGEEAVNDLQALGQLAQEILSRVPVIQGMAARSAIFLGFQMWAESPQGLTVGDLLEAVESEEWRRAIAHSSIRRDGFLQDWTVMWQQFHRMGWVEADDPLQGVETLPLGEMGWLDRPLSIRSQAIGRPAGGVASCGTAAGMEELSQAQKSPLSRESASIGLISREALERALAMRGMSQAMLARSLKLDRSTVNRWINGSRPISPRYQPLLWELLGTVLQEG